MGSNSESSEEQLGAGRRGGGGAKEKREEERGSSRGRNREMHQATGDCKDGPYSPPQPAQHHQQGLNLLSPPFHPFWSVLNTDGDRHCNTDKGSRLHLLLNALCTEQRGSSL